MESERTQMEPQIWQINWVDSYTMEGSWQSLELLNQLDESSLCKCTTVGYLVKDTGNSYVMAGSRNGTEYSGVIVIPKGSVVSKIVIR